MSELQDLLAAYAAARARGERRALATVTCVSGSAYRREGAHLLITESGEITGCISAGCLEADVALRAARLIEERGTALARYDMRGDEERVWGLGLGCNGVVDVLIESLHEGSNGAAALAFAADRLRTRERGVMAVVMSGRGLGQRILLAADGDVGSLAANPQWKRLGKDAADAIASGASSTRSYDDAAASEPLVVFFDVVTPPRRLVVCGAGSDALPLVRMGCALGWDVTVVDTRERPASHERFAGAGEVVLCRAAELQRGLTVATDSSVVVMTHHYDDDAALLRVLLPMPLPYLAVLGPRQRTDRLLDDLRDVPRSAQIFGPAGLDLGAETPEEIALAIVAEITAVASGRQGGSLTKRRAPIHASARRRRLVRPPEVSRPALETPRAL